MKPWTSAEELELVRLRSSGLSVPKIAQRLKRSKHSVYQRLVKKNMPWRPLRRQKYRELLGTMADVHVAFALGVTIHAVRKMKRKLRCAT